MVIEGVSWVIEGVFMSVHGCVPTCAHSLHCTLAAALAMASGSASNACGLTMMILLSL